MVVFQDGTTEIIFANYYTIVQYVEDTGIDLYLKLTIDLRGKLTTCMAGL